MADIKNNLKKYDYKHVGGPCYRLKINDNISIWYNDKAKHLTLCLQDGKPQKWTIFWDFKNDNNKS